MNVVRLVSHSKFHPFICLLFIFCVTLQGACTPAMITRSTKQLDDNISLFNLKFEGRAGHHAMFLVDPDFREGYMSKIYNFNERIRFMDSSMVGLQFLKNGLPVTKKPDDDDDESFNSALATFSYQLTISPSVTLESRTVKQKWVLKNDHWYVQPNLDIFFKSPPVSGK